MMVAPTSAGHGIKLAVEYRGHTTEEHVAQDAAADAGQHAENRGHDRRQTEIQRFLRAHHREQTKTGGVEDEHRTLDAINDMMAEKTPSVRQR